MFEDPRLSPAVRRLTPVGFDPNEAQHREMCAAALTLFETIAPIVRIMAEEDEFTPRPRRGRADRRSA